ncbi:MAG: universal stress protein [Alphaproteobacteria bacterium]|nr:universal stress protein [Alphaproteobacteria bacterium]
MPCRDMLIVIDEAASAAARLAPAATLAKRLNARLTGLYATGFPIGTTYGDLAGWAELMDAFMAAQRAEANAAEAAFRQELGRYQIEGDWVYSETDRTRSIIDRARLYDLVVLAQPDPDAEPRLQPPLRLEEVVLACGRPVLVIPYAGPFADLGHRALVAWNGSREATRALHDALFLLEGAEAVTVVEIDPAVNEAGEPGLGAADVAAFLTRRGIAAEAETARSDDVAVPDLLLSRAAEIGADVIVMGAYGHSRLREYVLGGASRSIFHQMTVPVLMAH